MNKHDEVIYEVYREKATNEPVIAARIPKDRLGGFGNKSKGIFWMVISEKAARAVESGSFYQRFKPWDNCRSYKFLFHDQRFSGYRCIEDVMTTVRQDTGTWAR